METNPTRVLSIDVFRGLTIFTMLFVNHIFDLGMTDIPDWLKHVPADGLTFSDIIFPAFLFIVGMAVPLSIDKRIRRGDTWWKLLGHIFARSGSLIIVGFLWVNWEYYPLDKGLISKHLWGLLLFIAVIMLWTIYPKPDAKSRRQVLYMLF